MFELALAVVDDGDEVIIPTPCWVSFPDQIRLCGGEPVFVESRADDGFRLRARTILDAITDRTRAIVLNSPCNPTGGMIDGDDLRAIVEAAAARGILVVSDETYERFVYDGPAFTSCAAFAAAHPETVVVVGSFSKTYAMTGWRLGYALGPTTVMNGLAAIQSHATSNPTSFAMPGALAAMREAEPDVRAMIEEFRIRRDLVVDLLNALPGVTCNAPAGAFYAFPHVAGCYRAGEGSTEFAERLLEEARVAVVPGAAFGNDEHVRLSFACSRDDLREGLRRMAAMLGAILSGVRRRHLAFEQCLDRGASRRGQVAGARCRERAVGERRLVLVPFAGAPGEPALAILVEHADFAVEELRELDAPAGAALDRLVGQDPTDREQPVAAHDHVELRLDHPPDPVTAVEGAAEAAEDDRHADVALLELGVAQDRDVRLALHDVTLEGDRHLGDAVALGTAAELGLGALVPAADQ